MLWRQEHGGQGKLKKARVWSWAFWSSANVLRSHQFVWFYQLEIEDTLPGHGWWGGLLPSWPRFFSLEGFADVTWTRLIHLDTWIPPSLAKQDQTLLAKLVPFKANEKWSHWAGRTFNCSPILKDQILGTSLSLTFCDSGWTSYLQQFFNGRVLEQY